MEHHSTVLVKLEGATPYPRNFCQKWWTFKQYFPSLEIFHSEEVSLHHHHYYYSAFVTNQTIEQQLPEEIAFLPPRILDSFPTLIFETKIPDV